MTSRKDSVHSYLVIDLFLLFPHDADLGNLSRYQRGIPHPPIPPSVLPPAYHPDPVLDYKTILRVLARISPGGSTGGPFPIRWRLEHQEKSAHDEDEDRTHAQAMASGPVYRPANDERPEKSRDFTG